MDRPRGQIPPVRRKGSMRKHLLRFSVGLPALLLTLVLATPAFGTSVLRVDTATHLLDSSAVVEGVVGTAKQSIDPATGRPVTDTTVRVDGVLWGSAAKGDLVVRQHKGSVEGMNFRIPGDGQLEAGQRVVLFLNQADGHFWLAALGQSVLEVHGAGPDAELRPQLDGLVFFTRNDDGAVVPLEETVLGPETLRELKAELAEAGE